MAGSVLAREHREDQRHHRAARAGRRDGPFAARAGEVGKAEGFEEFQLLRPADDRTTWLVYTRWRDEEAFEAWRASQSFGSGHAQGGGSQAQGGPVATGSELWSFLVEQRESTT